MNIFFLGFFYVNSLFDKINSMKTVFAVWNKWKFKLHIVFFSKKLVSQQFTFTSFEIAFAGDTSRSRFGINCAYSWI